MGATAPGWYNLDPSGDMKNNDNEFYCKDGWTYVMTREPKHPELKSSVSYIGPMTCFLSKFMFAMYCSSKEESMNTRKDLLLAMRVSWD